MESRRSFLKVIGGAAIASAGLGVGWASTREPDRALQPWSSAGAPEPDPRRRALSYAILAPNPHNRQPWLVRLVGQDELLLTCDPERRLPVTDPLDRQITIGLGCFLEVMQMAAAEDAFRAEITLFPEGEPYPRLDHRAVAHVRFVPDADVAVDPLFRQVLHRRSNKQAFDTSRPVGRGVMDLLKGTVRFGSKPGSTADPDTVTALRTLTIDGMRAELATPEALDESVRLTRVGKRAIEANPDGIDLGGAFFEALGALGMLQPDDMADPSSSTFQQMQDSLLAPMQTAVAFLWLTTPGNSRADQIAAGRDHVRVNLKATELGLSLHPQSQVLQEFPAMAKHLERAHLLLGARGEERVQMLSRLGYGPAVRPSPRWPASTRIAQA